MAGQSDTVQQQDTLNRYLLYFPRSKNVSPDVHSFCGEEELSKPYRYTIRFTSPNPNIAVKDVLNQMAEFIQRAPDPKAKSIWHNQESWLPVRQINGVITSFSRLKSSADEALYECVLEHELALLDRNYRSAVYMDMTVPDLVTKLMKESGHFQGYNIDFDQLSHNYPSREMIIQWKETDLQFIRRLLAEVGIWFRFENHDKVQGETVVIFGDGGRRYVFSNKQLPYVRHSGMTSHEEYVTELEEQYQLIPENVLVRTYNYRDPFSPQADKTIAGNDIPHGITRGKQYHYADHFLAAGDFYGQEAETASFYARLRYERLLNKQSVLGVTTSDPELLPGVMFHPTGDISDGFKPGFLVTTMTLSGSRAQHYRAILKGIPYLNGYSYRPDSLPRPVIAGTVPGRVAAINRDHTYAGVDAQGRYRVKFDFDLDEKRDGFESALMRLGRPYGGDVFGFHFPLLDGTEVAVAFEGGERLLICVDLHSDEEESKQMENVTALLFTNYYVKTEGEKRVYLYQPMTGVTDVETTVPVYLRAEAVSKPKQLWYTGLSRTEKYPLLEVLDEKKAVPDRLDLEMSLGEHSAGYVWLMLALASDAVVYAQGDQLVAASEQNRFSMTALSSRLTRQPDYPQQKRYTTPWEVCGIAGLMFFFGIMITIGTFGEGGKSISGWFLIIMAVLCIVIFCGMGVFFTWFYGDKAREHMGM